MCIYCGKSNTNKEEVDKHIMCHTRGKTQLGCEHCEKAFTQQHTQILTCEKLSSQKACFKGSQCYQTNPSRKYLADLARPGAAPQTPALLPVPGQLPHIFDSQIGTVCSVRSRQITWYIWSQEDEGKHLQTTLDGAAFLVTDPPLLTQTSKHK